MNEEKKTAIKSGFSKLIKDDKIKKLIIILGLVGIALIFISNFISTDKKTAGEQPPDSPKASYQNLDEYKNSTEKSLSSIISKIEGAGRTEVFLTLENGTEKVYAVNQRHNSSNDSSGGNSESLESEYYSIRNSNGSEDGMLLKVIEPEIRGVVVVCDGGDDSVIKERVLEAVTKALNISSARVCISKLSKQTKN